jgi:hypothetical protein
MIMVQVAQVCNHIISHIFKDSYKSEHKQATKSLLTGCISIYGKSRVKHPVNREPGNAPESWRKESKKNTAGPFAGNGIKKNRCVGTMFLYRNRAYNQPVCKTTTRLEITTIYIN